MKIFSVIFVAAIVAITIGRCRAEFLLVQVDDVAAKGNFYIHQGSIWGVMIRIYEFLKAQDQTIPQKDVKLRSLLDRVFVTSNHVAATPATHVIMRRFLGQRTLLKPNSTRSHRIHVVHLHAVFVAVVHLHVQPHVLDQLDQTVANLFLIQITEII